jgi:hypothetical protein
MGTQTLYAHMNKIKIKKKEMGKIIIEQVMGSM